MSLYCYDKLSSHFLLTPWYFRGFFFFYWLWLGIIYLLTHDLRIFSFPLIIYYQLLIYFILTYNLRFFDLVGLFIILSSISILYYWLFYTLFNRIFDYYFHLTLIFVSDFHSLGHCQVFIYVLGIGKNYLLFNKFKPLKLDGVFWHYF